MQSIRRPFWKGLTRKLLVGFGGVLIVLLLIAIILVVFLTSHSNALEAVRHENYDSMRFCDAMKKALDQVQAVAQSTPQNTPETAAKIEEAHHEFQTNAAAQLSNTTLPGEAENSRLIAETGNAVFADMHRLLNDSSISDKAAFYRDTLFPKYQICRTTLGQVSQMNLANLVRVNEQVRSALLAMRTTVILLLLLGLVLSTIFVVLTAHGMIRPLTQLINSVRQIETGNLDLVIETSGDDEIGMLALAFNDMAAKLREFRKIDHEKLIRSQQTTQAAIDSLPDAVAVLDIHGKIDIANRTARTFFKLEPGQSIRETRSDWAEMYFDPVIKTGRSVAPDGYRSAIQLFDENGERFLLPRSVPMLDEDQHLVGVTLILLDVTHLRKADEFKSGLISTVSHELKTPLTSMRVSMDFLLDKRVGELNTRQQTLLNASKADCERLVRTVEDILTIGRVEAGRTHVEKVDVLATEITQRAISTVESMAAEKAIALQKNFPDNVPLVHADINLVSCALSNLLTNAVKYSAAGSTVKIAVSVTETDVQFSVIDQGPGIPEAYRARIFERFFRIPAPEGPSGAGLGLFIAKEIVDLHHGKIRLAASSPAGSTFAFSLPRYESVGLL